METIARCRSQSSTSLKLSLLFKELFVASRFALVAINNLLLLFIDEGELTPEGL